MESKDSRKASSVLEETRTILVDSASALARRRRREVRLCRKAPNLSHQGPGLKHDCYRPMMCGKRLYIIDEARDFGNHHLNLSHQGDGLKHAGSRSMICGKRLYVIDEAQDCGNHHLASAMPKLSDAGQDIPDLMGNGLVRSRSFPPESWQTRKYILQISKLGRRNAGANGQTYAVTVVRDGQCGKLLRVSSTFSSPASGSIRMVRARAHGSYFSEDHPFLPQMQHHENMSCATPKVDHANPLQEEILAEKFPHKEGTDLSSPRQSTATIVGTCNTDNNVHATGKAIVVEGKSLTTTGLECDPVVSTKICPPNGKVLVCGRRREMEDAAVVVPSFAMASFDGTPTEFHFFGVYDGHGGSQASKYCAERLHQALSEEMENSELTADWGNEPEWWQKVLTCTFGKVDREVGGVCPFGACDNVKYTSASASSCCEDAIAPENVGTTAIVAVVSSSHIVVANCGDSRAVLSRGGKAVPLSKDHKPERADETSRIEAAGGEIIQWNGFRVGALLALSRAIGDRYLKRYVISQPDVVCLPRTQDDECLILASDGLWDVVDNETACDVARRCLASAHQNRERQMTSRGEDLACASIAATLVKLAFGRGSKDNITVLVIDLGV